MRTAMAAVALAMLAGCEQRGAAPTGNAAAETNQTAAAEPGAGPVEPAAAGKPLAIAASAADLSWGPCPAGMPQGCEIAVLHGDPAQPNADIFLRVPAGAAITPHWHSSAERMMLATGRLAVTYQGSAEAMLEPGSYAYGPARLPHKAECRSADPCTLFIAFEGPVDRHDFTGEI